MFLSILFVTFFCSRLRVHVCSDAKAARHEVSAALEIHALAPLSATRLPHYAMIARQRPGLDDSQI